MNHKIINLYQHKYEIKTLLNWYDFNGSPTSQQQQEPYGINENNLITFLISPIWFVAKIQTFQIQINRL